MKRLCLIALTLLLSIPLFSQSKKGDHEIAGGVGKTSGADLIYSSGSGNKDWTNYSIVVKPIFTVSHKYYFTRNCAIGVTLSQHSFYGSYVSTYPNRQYHSYSYDGLSVCVEMKHTIPFTNTPYFQLYYGAGIGATFFTNNGEKGLALYISPLGFRLGKDGGIYAEVGLGYKGLVHGGYSIRFGKRKNEKKK